MVDVNGGKPYHLPGFETGVPPLWPDAKEGDEIAIRNTLGTQFYKFRHGEWQKCGWSPRSEMPVP